MIFNENLENTSLDSIEDGIKIYSVITGQLADNLHDLMKVADGYKEMADSINEAESKVRQASSILVDLCEKFGQSKE